MNPQSIAILFPRAWQTRDCLSAIRRVSNAFPTVAIEVTKGDTDEPCVDTVPMGFEHLVASLVNQKTMKGTTMPSLPTWTPTAHPNGSHRMGVAKLGSVSRVASVLGPPNCEDDPSKVAASYAGEITLPDGRSVCLAIWDWKGSAESCGYWSVHCKPVELMDDAIRTLESMVNP
jgi:hypothetical protein